MKNRTAVWGALVMLGFVALVWLALSSPPVPRVKARALRITSVNTLRSVSFTLTNSSALPGARPASDR